MFRQRQKLHRWAARVLLLWLFGVGVGIAHACLAPNLGLPGGPVAAQAMGEGVPHHGATAAGAHHDHAGPAQPELGNPGQQGSAAKSNCADFCDKAGISILPLKSVPADDLGHALPVAAVAVVLTVPVFEPVQLWVPRRDGVWAPPIPIAFLRLAL